MFQDDLSYISDFLSFLHIPQHRLTRDEEEEEEEDGEMPQEARERLLLVKNMANVGNRVLQVDHFR